MDLRQLRQEFNVRYYRWAQLVAETEIANSFPHLQSFNGGTTWKMYQFMRLLDQNAQNLYARALLKHYHADAAKALGEAISDEERTLLDQGWSFNPYNVGREVEVQRRREAGEKIRFAGKRMLRATMAAKFWESFGEKCVDRNQVETAAELRFLIKFHPWEVLTSFWFGRGRTVISYKHLIASEERISHPAHPEITSPAILITFVCWIGLFPIEWEYIYSDEAASACDAVVSQCRQVFGQMPILLDGLSG